eukprot:jgi/Botrbrau1/18416/Bobra.0072s0009.1
MQSMKRYNCHVSGISLMRVGACISILLGHCLYWVGHSSSSIEDFYDRATASWATVTLNALEPAMDVFLVLTGFLAGVALIPSLQNTSDKFSLVRRYYQKRAVRLLPNYYCTLVFAYFVFYPLKGSMNEETQRAFFTIIPFPDICKEAKWANFFFAQNQYPMSGCMGYTWSLAVQVQFYLILPIILLLLRPSAPNFRWRVFWTCVATSLTVLVLRAKILRDPRVHMPVPLLGPHTPENSALVLLLAEKSYYTLVPRLNAMAYGVVAALVYTDDHLLGLIMRNRKMVKYVLRILLLSISAGLGVNKVGAQEDVTHPLSNKGLMFVGFVLSLGIIQPATIALATVYVASGPEKPGGKLAAVLSWVADQTYDIYLLHPLVLFILFGAIPPSTWFFKGPAASKTTFFAFGALTLALSIMAGHVQRALCSAVGFRISQAVRTMSQHKSQNQNC